MPIALSCPGCQAEFRLADELAGKQVQCANCARILQVPRLPTAPGPIGAELPSGAIQDARPGPPLPYSQPPPASTPAAAPPARASSWDDDEERRLPRRRARRAEARGSRRTPVFVWLVPLLFAGLFLVLGAVGAVVINANRAARNPGGWPNKAVVPAAPVGGDRPDFK
jgi:hypothetical protein